MGLTNLWAFFWAGLAIPIVIFYILKIRMRRIPVSTVMFWKEIFEEKQPRSIWQQLRHLLSLLLQLAFLALLVMALADPFFNWELRNARRIVLVVDNSASMRATDVLPTRLAVAKEKAVEIIDGLRPRDEMAIVAAGTEPQVICGLTSHQRTLRRALDSVLETDGPTRVPEAVSLARRLMAGHDNAKAVVLSDGCFDKSKELLAADDVVPISVGTKSGNVGITRFQVRRSLLDPLGYQILAEVANFSEEKAKCRLEVDLDSQVVDVVPIEIEPGKRWSQVFDKTSPVGGRLEARLDFEDAFIADNMAYAILPNRKRQKILLITPGNIFLQRVFEAHPLVDLTVAATAPEKLPADTLVVYHRTAPEKLTGNAFVIEPATSTDTWDLADKLDDPIVAEQDKESKLMANVRLDNALMPEARRLKLKGDAKVLAKSATGDPLYFSREREEEKLLVLTVNLDRGDLPLRTAFPILVTNALDWFAGESGELRESLATGAVTDVELPQSLRDGGDAKTESAVGGVVLRSPDGREQAVTVSTEGRATIGPLDRCGVWRIERKLIGKANSPKPVNTEPTNANEEAEESVDIACNLANAAESDVRTAEESTALQTTEKGTAQSQFLTSGWGARPLWFYLVLVGTCLVVSEWYLYQRRWIS